MGEDRAGLVEAWLREEEQPFTGWDFPIWMGACGGSGSRGRTRTGQRSSSSVIDLDTGGGEKLLGLREHWPARVVATEDYGPNFELASERLFAAGRGGRAVCGLRYSAHAFPGRRVRPGAEPSCAVQPERGGARPVSGRHVPGRNRCTGCGCGICRRPSMRPHRCRTTHRRSTCRTWKRPV